jgi:hypothetical protein
MKLRKPIMASVLVCLLAPLAIAQSKPPDVSVEPYVPRLADIMAALQVRHSKLYSAGRAQNWELTDFELRQLSAGLAEAAMLYPGIPVTNVTRLAAPVQSLSDAVKAKDEHKFTEAMDQLTNGCNACHLSMDRKFIVIRLPTGQPFTNQIFAPQGRK